MDSKDLLTYLSIKYNGDFYKMMDAIKNREKVDEKELNKALKQFKKSGAKVLTILDEEYPENLKKMYQPPIVLYYKGDISLLKAKRKLAVLGCRDASEYGKNITKQIVKGLDEDTIIVGGLARGISAIAHQECLNNKMKTIGVLGCGINYIYPKCNSKLFKTISKNGLLISEYPDMVEPSPDNFNMRNRIVAGISDKLLVTETSVHSGTNITVLFALQQGKDVMAIPSRVGDTNDGCNKLIRDGAILVENAIDVNDMTKE